MLQTHPYTYGYDMQNVVAGPSLKDMDSLVTNTSVYIRMQLPSCKTHPCKYGCVCSAANAFVRLRMRMQLCKTHSCCYGCVCSAANTSVHLRIWYAKRRRRLRTEGDGPARNKHIRIHRNAISYMQNSPVKLRMCLQRCKHIRTFTNRFATLKTYP